MTGQTTTPDGHTAAALFILAAGLIAAVNLVVVEVILTTYQVDPLLAALLGNITGGIFLLTVMNRRRPSGQMLRQRRVWRGILLAGLLIYSAASLTMFDAIGRIGAGKMGLLTQLETPFVMLLAVIFLGEALTGRRLLAAALAVMGALLISYDPQALSITLTLGELEGIIAPFLFAAGIVASKPLLDQMNAGWLTGMLLLVGTGGLLLVSPLFVDNWAIPPIALLWIFASGSMRGFVWMMFNVGIKRIGPSRGSILFLSHSFFVVGIQLLADWLFPGLNLRVPPNLLLSLAGGALIAFGIIYMQREKAPVPVPLT